MKQNLISPCPKLFSNRIWLIILEISPFGSVGDTFICGIRISEALSFYLTIAVVYVLYLRPRSPVVTFRPPMPSEVMFSRVTKFFSFSRTDVKSAKVDFHDSPPLPDLTDTMIATLLNVPLIYIPEKPISTVQVICYGEISVGIVFESLSGANKI